MSSPAKRRHDRLARRRTKKQAERRYWAKREARGLHIIGPGIAIGRLRDITPFRPSGLVTVASAYREDAK